MTTTTVAGSPSPPAPVPRRRLPSMEPLRIRCTARLFVRWSNVVRGPQGEVGLVTHVWASKAAWKRRPYRLDPGWVVEDHGFVLIAWRLDW